MHLLPFLLGVVTKPLAVVCDAGECHIVRPALPKPTRLQAELAALHRRTAKQGCASKSDSQSHISGTGECGHITHGHSTPTLAQRLVGGVTSPCSILPTYSIGCAVRRATCTHAPLRPVSLDPAFAHSIGTKPRLILFPKAEALAVTPHKGGREVAAATAHSGSLRSCGFHGLLTRHGSTSKSQSAVGAGHRPMWRKLRLHGVPVEGEGSRFVSVPAQR